MLRISRLLRASEDPELQGLPPIKWSYPTDKELLNEVQSEYSIEKHFINATWPKDDDYAQAIRDLKEIGAPTQLDPKAIKGLHLWDSYEDLKKTVSSFGIPKNPASMVEAIRNGHPLPMPIVCRDRAGALEVRGGNTRSGIAALVGQPITALVFNLGDAEGRLAQRLETNADHLAERKGKEYIFDAVRSYFLEDGPKPTYVEKDDYFFAFIIGSRFSTIAKLKGIDVSDKEKRFEDELVKLSG